MNRLPSSMRYKRHLERWKRYERLNQRTSIQFIDYALSRLPFRTEVIQTDNGSEFEGQYHWHVLDKGINHVYIKPRRPRFNDHASYYTPLDIFIID